MELTLFCYLNIKTDHRLFRALYRFGKQDI